ncbi:MAG: hypothetical protein KatS3mg031_2455 [Chitinophagales bacterium]|nr:MAG: hypothetical protein KatS3mg031_2455 [Chitinophagales bacterium]
MMNLVRLLLLFTPAVLVAQVPLGIGQWRTHVPYRNATSVTDAGNKVYVATDVFFFSYDKETGQLQSFDKASGLSDVGVTLVKVNPHNNMLLIVYDNTNLDILEGNTIFNISDIKRKQIVGKKQINRVTFMGDLAYLSCSFGIVVLDMVRKEIKDTYRIGNQGANLEVFDFAADTSSFYAATAEGIKVASRNSPNLLNFSEWQPIVGLPARLAKNIVRFQGRLFANVQDTLYVYDGNIWSFFYAQPAWRLENVLSTAKHLVLCETAEPLTYQGRIGLIDSSFLCCNYLVNPFRIRYPTDAVMDSNGTWWIADFLEGLIKLSEDNADAIYPTGPGSVNVQSMDVQRGQLWVAPGSVDQSYSFDGYNIDGVFQFVSNEWRNYNVYTHAAFDTIYNFWKVAVHPERDRVYFGSWWGGLLEYRDGNFTVFNQYNSILEGLPGFEARTVISGLTFDDRGTLWMTSYGTNRPIIALQDDGTWFSFTAPGVKGNQLERLLVDDYDQKWIVIPRVSNQSLLVFNHGQDLTSTTDDQYKIYGTGQGNGNLPSNEVYALAKDLDGEIWVGTAQGIAVFYCPGAVFSQSGCEAQQIIVTQNGVAGYLLETERVSAIAVDGGNRKWVGTSNGVFLLSPDGTRQIAYYTVDNSPLLSNVITDIAIDHSTGEVFIGTSRGIVSIRGEATEGGAQHTQVMVFPNPVRADYEGPIAIKGLANNATVKITDTAGRLFYETKALGGQAVWNGRNYHGEKAKTGVYLIFSSGEDGSSSYVTKFLIIN